MASVHVVVSKSRREGSVVHMHEIARCLACGYWRGIVDYHVQRLLHAFCVVLRTTQSTKVKSSRMTEDMAAHNVVLVYGLLGRHLQS